MNLQKTVALLITLIIGGLSASAQGTLTITFNGPPPQPRGTLYGVRDYLEAGMLFTPVVDPYEPGSLIDRNGGGVDFFPDRDSAYIQTGAFGVEFRFTAASPFGLRSLDLAGFSVESPDFALQFIGFRPDGTSLVAEFVGSGIEWRTVQFGPEWASGLTRVEVPPGINAYASIDDIVVLIPEPTEISLLLIGALGALLRRRSQP